MATKRKSNRTQRTIRRSPAAHLLVIECETQKLSRQGLSLGTEVAERAKKMFPGKKIALVQTSILPQLLTDLADTHKDYGRFRSILLVGHSDASGLRLTSEKFYPWGAVAQWVALFNPEFFLIAGCNAGQFLPVRELFKGISSLREVYASPVTLHRDQSEPLILLVFQLLEHRKVNETILRIVQVANFVKSRGVLYRWKRNEFRRGNEISGTAWTALGSVLNERR